MKFRFLQNPNVYLVGPKIVDDELIAAIALFRPGVDLEESQTLYSENRQAIVIRLPQVLSTKQLNVTFEILELQGNINV